MMAISTASPSMASLSISGRSIGIFPLSQREMVTCPAWPCMLNRSASWVCERPSFRRASRSSEPVTGGILAPRSLACDGIPCISFPGVPSGVIIDLEGFDCASGPSVCRDPRVDGDLEEVAVALPGRRDDLGPHPPSPILYPSHQCLCFALRHRAALHHHNTALRYICQGVEG